MKVRIKASENYQEVETVVEVESTTEITKLLLQLRRAIKDATTDIKPKIKEEEKVERQATEGQYKYLNSLGWSGEHNLTFDEASHIIKEMGGSQLRSK